VPNRVSQATKASPSKEKVPPTIDITPPEEMTCTLATKTTQVVKEKTLSLSTKATPAKVKLPTVITNYHPQEGDHNLGNLKQIQRKVKKRILSASMWVMVQDVRRLEFSGKFDALWTSLYIIKEVFLNNSIQLKNLDGLEFPTRTNGGRCKKYKL
jgi:hypothetical protein